MQTIITMTGWARQHEGYKESVGLQQVSKVPARGTLLTYQLAYPSLADSLRHLPWRLNNLSGTPSCAAAEALPERRL